MLNLLAQLRWPSHALLVAVVVSLHVAFGSVATLRAEPASAIATDEAMYAEPADANSRVRERAMTSVMVPGAAATDRAPSKTRKPLKVAKKEAIVTESTADPETADEPQLLNKRPEPPVKAPSKTATAAPKTLPGAALDEEISPATTMPPRAVKRGSPTLTDIERDLPTTSTPAPMTAPVKKTIKPSSSSAAKAAKENQSSSTETSSPVATKSAKQPTVVKDEPPAAISKPATISKAPVAKPAAKTESAKPEAGKVAKPTPAPKAESQANDSEPAVPQMLARPAPRAQVIENNTQAEVEEPAPPVSEQATADSDDKLATESGDELVESEAAASKPAVVGRRGNPSIAMPSLGSSGSEAAKPTYSDALPPPAEIKVETAGFNDATPGVTTVAELNEKWGSDFRTATVGGGEMRSYKIEPFRRVSVSVKKGKVASIVVQFAEPLAPEKLAEQLQIDDVRSVPVMDESGQKLGEAFPERGVLFTYEADSEAVGHVVLEPIDLESFILRAENTLATKPHLALADLDYVISKNSDQSQAHFLRAKLMYDQGRPRDALASINRALDHDLDQPLYRLLKGKILAAQGRRSEAISMLGDLARGQGVPAHLKAAAYTAWGTALAGGAEPDAKAAIDMQQKAIQMAEPLSVSAKSAVRKFCKEVLVDANLGVAYAIAIGNWQQKDRVASMWIQRARDHAADLTTNEGAEPEMMLKVCQGALAAARGSSGKIASGGWASTTHQQAKRVLAQTNDSLRERRVAWAAGVALSDAILAELARGNAERALELATITTEYLEQGSNSRQRTAYENYLVGRLYFRLGATQAIHNGDHLAAVALFEKALPLLDRPLPQLSKFEEGHYGESFVSMGISYWETGRHEEGVKLTRRGVELMSAAVKRHLLDQKSLEVPYGNLATMYRDLGHEDQAKRFAELSHPGATKKR